MSVIFLLGPGLWDPARRPAGARNPLNIRRDIARILRSHGHGVILMEDDPDRPGEDLIGKFDRLLRHSKVTDIVLYWPGQTVAPEDAKLNLYSHNRRVRFLCD